MPGATAHSQRLLDHTIPPKHACHTHIHTTTTTSAFVHNATSAQQPPFAQQPFPTQQSASPAPGERCVIHRAVGAHDRRGLQRTPLHRVWDLHPAPRGVDGKLSIAPVDSEACQGGMGISTRTWCARERGAHNCRASAGRLSGLVGAHPLKPHTRGNTHTYRERWTWCPSNA